VSEATFPEPLRRAAAHVRRTFRENPLAGAMTLGTVFACLYVVVYPFLVVTYPPMTDLPFHAAGMSILRHYFDPSYHFREQFSLHFLATPYWTLHCLGGLLAFFMPITWAAKGASMTMLALLPVGSAVMFHGMKKSPYLGLLALPFAWNKLTHWGFLNFMGAIGLFAMTVGLTFLVLDRPTRRRQVALAIALVAVFGTHIFRFPFALGAVPAIAIALWPATRRITPILLPMVPAGILLVIWLLVRSKEVTTDEMAPLAFHFERIEEVGSLLFGSFNGPREQEYAHRTYVVLAGIVGYNLAGYVSEGRWRRLKGRNGWFIVGTHVSILGIALACFALFLTLPMQIGVSWWYVYPREIVSTLFIAMGLVPNLPRIQWARLPVVAAIAATSMAQAFLVAEKYSEFDNVTADFDRIIETIPRGAKLGYMVYDHGGSNRSDTPFIHMPAWVQAKKGGTLSFHFVIWKVWPIWYREDSPAVPPPTPPRFEWTPDNFDIGTRGKFFDWFLVRAPWNPDARFRADPSIHFVRHEGTWWLYKRN
jgi:hypothetical protein